MRHVRGSGMNPLAQILEETLKRLELGDVALEARAVLLWPDIVGGQLARVSEARSVRAGTLLVNTRSSAWNQELSFQKGAVIRRYRERLGKDIVKDLRFNVGPVRGVATPELKPPPDSELRKLRLSDEEIQEIRAASQTEDAELSQAIRRALTREAQVRQWHLAHGARPCPRCGAAHRTPHHLCPACRQDDATADAPL